MSKGLKCYLYWIREPTMTDIFSEGYVGISTNPDLRLLQHKSHSKTNSHHKYNKAFRKALLSGNYIHSIILVGSIDYCMEVERKLRPSIFTGWNKAIGGDGGTNHKHGMTGTPEFKILTYLKSFARKNENVWLCEKWSNPGTGTKDFVEFYKSMKADDCEMKLPVVGEISESTVRFLPRREINQERSRTYDIGDGILRTVQEIGQMLGIRPNTISTNMSRGYTLRQSCGLDPKPTRVVVIDGAEFKYSGPLTEDEIHTIKFHVEQGYTTREISKLVPMSESNLSRIITRFNLRKDFNARAVD